MAYRLFLFFMYFFNRTGSSKKTYFPLGSSEGSYRLLMSFENFHFLFKLNLILNVLKIKKLVRNVNKIINKEVKIKIQFLKIYTELEGVIERKSSLAFWACY